jgi:hypothetical protein
MCVLIFSTTFVWNISHSKKNSARYDNNVNRSTCKATHYYCHNLTKPEFSQQIYEKYWIVKFHKSRPVAAKSFLGDLSKPASIWITCTDISVFWFRQTTEETNITGLNFWDFLVTMAQSNPLGRFWLSPRLTRLWWPHSTHSTCTKLTQSCQMLYRLFRDRNLRAGVAISRL